MMKQRSILFITYLSAFLFSFHVALTAYANSSFAETLVGKNFVGLLYGAASLCALIGLAYMPKIMYAIGNKKTALTFLGLSTLSLSLLSLNISPIISSLFLILYLASSTLVFFTLDVFIEHNSEDRSTGKTRGLYLSIIALGWVAAPVSAGILITSGGFTRLYLTASLLIIAIFILLGRGIKGYADAYYERKSLKEALKELSFHPNIRTLITINFLLQFFYAWMVIYLPIYLIDTIGFSWGVVGGIFTIMLMPFVLTEYPLGLLADHNWKVRRIVQFGFAITMVATICLSFISTPLLPLWITLLFMTRIGAAMIESMAEISFFKQTTDQDTHFLSLFRDTTPFAYLIAPVLGTLLLFVIPFHSLFLLLGSILGYGIIVAGRLTGPTYEKL